MYRILVFTCLYVAICYNLLCFSQHGFFGTSATQTKTAIRIIMAFVIKQAVEATD